jgi:dTDP-4-dehydrorhamnose reductase
MRLAITGTTGRVGRALADRLAADHEIVPLPRAALDLARPEAAARAVADLDFDVLLNPAGVTGLEACEDDPGLARQVNAVAPAVLAVACGGRPMLHFSTDYVFGGETPGWRQEDEPTGPLSVYGRSKADGEAGVLAAGGAVMRVSWVFGPEKPAFPDQILRQALDGGELAAVADKFSLPCFTPDLCDWVSRWLGAGCPADIFHACNRGEPASWHDIACEITDFLTAAGRPVAKVKALALDEMAAFRARRPRHTAMATGRLNRLLGEPPRHWREALREHLAMSLISR